MPASTKKQEPSISLSQLNVCTYFSNSVRRSRRSFNPPGKSIEDISPPRISGRNGVQSRNISDILLVGSAAEANLHAWQTSGGLVLHKSPNLSTPGDNSSAPACRRSFMLDHTSICPPGASSRCSRPFGLLRSRESPRDTQPRPGREKTKNRKRGKGTTRRENGRGNREGTPEGVKERGKNKKKKFTHIRTTARERKREREGLKGAAPLSWRIRKNRRLPDVRPEYKREIVSFSQYRGPFSSPS